MMPRRNLFRVCPSSEMLHMAGRRNPSFVDWVSDGLSVVLRVTTSRDFQEHEDLASLKARTIAFRFRILLSISCPGLVMMLRISFPVFVNHSCHS